jgi:VWFA-related protein
LLVRRAAAIEGALAKVLMRPPVTGPSSSSLMEQSGFPGAGGASASESAATGMRARLDADPGYTSRREVVDSTSLANLVDGMAQYAGRRVVLLLSEGLYISPRLTNAGKAAIRQNVSIYAIDAAGFTGDAHAQSDVTAWADFNSASRFDPDLRLQYHESDRTKGLGPIAWWTGGLRLGGTNDLAASIRRATEDWRPYYLLAYQAPAGVTSSASPRIEVRVARPGLAVRARQIRGQ